MCTRVMGGEEGSQQCCVPSAARVGVCSLCSGESGAGKTESCKFIVGHLTELSHAKSLTEQKIIQVGGACHPSGWGMSSKWVEHVMQVGGHVIQVGGACHPGGWGMSCRWVGPILSQHSYVTSQLVYWFLSTVCVSMHVLSSSAPSSPHPLSSPPPLR